MTFRIHCDWAQRNMTPRELDYRGPAPAPEFAACLQHTHFTLYNGATLAPSNPNDDSR